MAFSAISELRFSCFSAPQRPSSHQADPHFYSGHFLRFGAIEKNIPYFDIHTLREETAQHCVLDEFHYGTPASLCPAGAQTLLDKVLLHHKPAADGPPEVDKPFSDFLVQPLTALNDVVPVPLDTVDPTALLPASSSPSAATAQLLAQMHQQEFLHMKITCDMYNSPTILLIAINRLPTLGIIIKHISRLPALPVIHTCRSGLPNLPLI